MSASLLNTIVAAARTAAALREAAGESASAAPTRPRGAFRRALATSGMQVIAECKRRSPSRGLLRETYDPAAIAAAYAKGGAAAVSVLTEPTFFDGALDHLRATRDAVDLPLLRKDFIVSPFQVREARAAGADAVLLIVAALTTDELATLLRVADDHGLDALVETHDAAEITRALEAGADIIGVNCRNLHTLEVDPERLFRLAERVPPSVTAVAESGIRDAATMSQLETAGYSACLIGERFMAAADPGAALQELRAGLTAAQRAQA